MPSLTVELDTSLLQFHIEALASELDILEGVPNHFVRDIGCLLPNIILGKCSPTLRADGTLHVVQSLDFFGGFEGLRAAVLTAKRDVAHR
jgi:hypothetical protein